MTDVLIINPLQRKVYGNLSDYDLPAIEPPIMGAILANKLNKAGYSVYVCDANLHAVDNQWILKVVKSYNPSLIIIQAVGQNPTASTTIMPYVEELVSSLRVDGYCDENDIRIALYGNHPTALPEKTLKEISTDFIILGNGLNTVVPLIEEITGKKGHDYIPGLAYITHLDRIHGYIAINPPMEGIDPHDLSPDWSYLLMAEYRAHNWHCLNNLDERQPYGILLTSVGCPYNCYFCPTSGNQQKVVYRPIDDIMDDLEYQVERCGISNIKIIDEMFTAHPQRVSKICKLISERKWDLNMWAYARVGSVDERLLADMRAAGIRWLGYGFESGNDLILSGMRKGTADESVMTARMTESAGIHIGGNFMFGFPDDNLDTMQQTLDLAVEIMPEWANFNSLMAFPGSKLYEDTLRDNPDYLPERWEQYSQYSPDCKPLETKYLLSEDVLAFRDYAFNTYYKNPRYLAMIERKFGAQARQHIQDMTKHELKRNL
jgi:radical SAM superfamily enzyme YgiQ (UPF0313 family)